MSFNPPERLSPRTRWPMPESCVGVMTKTHFPLGTYAPHKHVSVHIRHPQKHRHTSKIFWRQTGLHFTSSSTAPPLSIPPTPLLLLRGQSFFSVSLRGHSQPQPPLLCGVGCSWRAWQRDGERQKDRKKGKACHSPTTRLSFEVTQWLVASYLNNLEAHS